MIPRTLQNRIRIQSTAFLLCDVQGQFRPHIHGFQHVVDTSSKMIEAGKILDIPLLVTEQYPQKLGPTVPELDISHAKLIDHKTKFSMCTRKVQDYIEANSQINHLVLFGIESHVCVLQTCLELLRGEYQVYVVSDGVSSMNAKEVPIALQRMRQEGAVVTTSDSVIFELTNDAQHEKFKAISNLIKSFKQKTIDAFNGLAH